MFTEWCDLWDFKFSKNAKKIRKNEKILKRILSSTSTLRVSRAVTWLTVYRSLYIEVLEKKKSFVSCFRIFIIFFVFFEIWNVMNRTIRSILSSHIRYFFLVCKSICRETSFEISKKILYFLRFFGRFTFLRAARKK